MHWLSTRSLLSQLDQGRLPPGEQGRYFAALVLLWGAPFAVELPGEKLALLQLLVPWAVAVLGAAYAFHRASTSTRTRFLEVVVPIGFLTAVHMALLAFALIGLLVAISAFTELFDESEPIIDMAFLAGLVALQTLYWWLVARRISRIGGALAA